MVFLGLGSNIGEREQFLRLAVSALDQTEHVELCGVSSVYETEPYGRKEQPPFLNLVAAVRTTLPPPTLLAVCQQIELDLKRERKIHWGPRTIDIDILLFDGQEICLPELAVPHPYLKKRRFVLTPLAELAAELLLDGQSIAAWLANCPDQGEVKFYADFYYEGWRKWREKYYF